MREIKYKAWLEDEQEMVGANDFYQNADELPNGDKTGVHLSDFFNKNEDGTFGKEHEKIIWLEYTGLKDKNDKEIYEGDVVKYTKHKSYLLADFIGEVKWWKSGCWDFFTTAGYPRIGIQTAHELERDILSHIEIIGNLYENPELLAP